MAEGRAALQQTRAKFPFVAEADALPVGKPRDLAVARALQRRVCGTVGLRKPGATEVEGCVVEAAGDNVRHVARLDPGAYGNGGKILAVVAGGRVLHRRRTSRGRGRSDDLA